MGFWTLAVFEALKRYGDLEGHPDLREEMERHREQQPAQRSFGPAQSCSEVP
ncbi:hypothetical protein [Wenzhouxiangella sp. 15181]|uniref:hypothetical protein n=1 Tax=Wenzhouxiangella sp. 15181 TaxID=2301224 RepID=UPI0015F24DC8|nr:hypothetical protein [Wenzhouxiangella sp. 15181]